MDEMYSKYYNDNFDKASFDSVVRILQSHGFSNEEIATVLTGGKLYHGTPIRKLYYIKIDISKKYHLYVTGINYQTYLHELNNRLDYAVEKSQDEHNKRSILLKVEHTITDIDILDTIVKKLNMIENILVVSYMPYKDKAYKCFRYPGVGIEIRCRTSDLHKCPEIAKIIKDILGNNCSCIFAIRVFGIIFYDSLFSISFPTTKSGIIIERKSVKSLDTIIELLKSSVEQIDISDIEEGSRAWRITFTAPYIYPQEVFHNFMSQNIEAKVFGNSRNHSFEKDDLGPDKWTIIPIKSRSSFDDEENVMGGISSGHGEYYGR